MQDIQHYEVSPSGSFMFSSHGDGLVSLKYLPEGRVKELDILMFPGYFKPEPSDVKIEPIDEEEKEN